MTTLFVNACLRGESSRTLILCREYLEHKTDVVEVNLAELDIRPLDAEKVAYRSEQQRAKNWDDPLFALSKQFAQADEIVVGAPYWDLSFPAALKAYMEQVSVCDIAFRYTADARCEGICKASCLTYITTSGGFVNNMHLGYGYFQGIATMFGIPETRLIAAEGLDIQGIDIDAQMNEARKLLAEIG